MDPTGEAVPVICRRCGAQYDVALFAFGRGVPCTCGAWVDASDPHAAAPEPGRTPKDARDDAERLRREADGITWTVLYGDVPWIDVEIAIDGLREWVRARLPDRIDLFERVYVARWRRLREQGWARGRGPEDAWS